MGAPDVRLQMRDMEKRFGGVTALAGVSIDVRPGEVHAIVGENGAGKSTLMKILSGAITDYSGQLIINGQPVSFSGPRDAESFGVSCIYQELNLVPQLSTAANIFLGRWPKRGVFVDKRRMESEASAILERLRVDIASVNARVESLSGGRQQSVAIARAISFNPKVLILDEPTANLSVPATERLLELMLELKRQGVAQVIISHRLQDIFAVGDRVMVLKRGRHVGERTIKQTTEDEVLRLIVHGEADDGARRE